MGSPRVRQDWSDRTQVYVSGKQREAARQACPKTEESVPFAPSPLLPVFIFSWLFQGKDTCSLLFYFLAFLLPKTFFLEDDTFILADCNRDSSASYPRPGGVRAVSSAVSGSAGPSGLQPARNPLLCAWDSPDRNTGVGFHALLQAISPSQGLNPCLCLPHWQAGSLPPVPEHKEQAACRQRVWRLCWPQEGRLCRESETPAICSNLPTYSFSLSPSIILLIKFQTCTPILAQTLST